MRVINSNYQRMTNLTNGDAVIIIATLTEDQCGKQAVYIASALESDPDYRSDRYAERVAYHGYKISFKEAVRHFPGLDSKIYRS